MQHFDYQTPECIVFNVLSESVLCTSIGADLVMSYYAGDLAQFNTPFDQADADANTALVFNHVAKYYTPYQW